MYAGAESEVRANMTESVMNAMGGTTSIYHGLWRSSFW